MEENEELLEEANYGFEDNSDDFIEAIDIFENDPGNGSVRMVHTKINNIMMSQLCLKNLGKREKASGHGSFYCCQL